MKTKDKNHYLTRTIYSLILLLSSLVLEAKEFLISYRYVVKDAVLYNEKLYISDSMKRCEGQSQRPLILTSYGEDNLRLTISKNSEEFIEYIHKLGLLVEHKEKTINNQNISTTILTLKTTCFKVDFNDNFVRIAPLR